MKTIDLCEHALNGQDGRLDPICPIDTHAVASVKKKSQNHSRDPGLWANSRWPLKGSSLTIHVSLEFIPRMREKGIVTSLRQRLHFSSIPVSMRRATSCPQKQRTCSAVQASSVIA